MSRRATPLRLRIQETLAVLLSLGYTWGYLKGWTPWCFLPAAMGAVLFLDLCRRKGIFAEAALQAFYIGMAAYGAWASAHPQDWTPREWTPEVHLVAVLSAALLTFIAAEGLRRYTPSALPRIDAFTTVFSLLATWLMVRNHHANWAYWIAIDTVSIFLYAKRGLPLGAALYAIYLVMALMGWFGW